jgi:hypothetical protein
MVEKNQNHQSSPQFDYLYDIALYNNDAKEALKHYFKSILNGRILTENLLLLSQDEIKELRERRLYHPIHRK